MESGVGNRFSAALAHAVGAVGHPRDRGVDVDEMGPGLVPEGVDLGPLECDRRALGIVLVVGVAVARRVHDPVEVARQRRQPVERRLSFLLEDAAGLLHPSIVAPAPDAPRPPIRAGR